MLYITSNSTGDGQFSIEVTFELGTDLDIAQVQVQNRVAIAQPRLPQDVRNIGVTVAKASPDLMMVVHLYSPDNSRDTLFISNYASTQVTDVLNRISGIGSITVFGSRDYSMRVWLDPDRLQSLNLTSGDVVTALQGQNVQVASGTLNQPPVANPGAFQLSVRTLGRLRDPDQFADIVVKQTDNAVVRLKDVGRVELAAQDYGRNSYLDRDPAIGPRHLPAAGIERARAPPRRSSRRWRSSRRSFPRASSTRSSTIPPSSSSSRSTRSSPPSARRSILVVLVVILFLQTWRAAIIPILAIPISLVGTFFFMAMFGFSLNNLSLFGLVLAIGIVVDDAIVVVESVERNIAAGLSPRDAAKRTMDEVGSALIAIALVLCAVFAPAAFITGISGQILPPVRADDRRRNHHLAHRLADAVAGHLRAAVCNRTPSAAKPRWWSMPLRGFFKAFNWSFDRLGAGYGWFTARVVRFAAIMLVIYGAVLAFGMNEFRKTPIGFIPQLDVGYLIVVTQLPGGASLARTDAVNRRAAEIALEVPGVAHAVNIVGFSGATRTAAPNAGAVFVVLDPFEKRAGNPSLSAPAIQGDASASSCRVIQEGPVIVAMPPPVRGIGTAGGFRMMVEDRGGRGPQELQNAVYAMMGRAAQTPGLQQVYSLFEILDAAALSRHRPHQGADAGHQGARRVRRAADLPRLDLRQRLQPARAHLPRHRAGRRALPARAERRHEDPRAQLTGRMPCRSAPSRR